MDLIKRIFWMMFSAYFLISGYGTLHISTFRTIWLGSIALVCIYMAMQGLKRSPTGKREK